MAVCVDLIRLKNRLGIPPTGNGTLDDSGVVFVTTMLRALDSTRITGEVIVLIQIVTVIKIVT